MKYLAIQKLQIVANLNEKLYTMGSQANPKTEEIMPIRLNDIRSQIR